MQLRSSSLWLGLLGLLFTLTGCRSDNGKPQVAFVSNNAYSFWTFAEKGAQKAADEFGVTLEFRKPSKATVEVQRQIIQDLLNRGFKGIAVSPNDPTNNVGYYKDSVAPKVALVMTDNDLPDPSARKCYIGTHNYRAGRAAGELVKKALPKGGEIAIFVGQMDATNAIERRQGVLDVLAGKDLKEMGEITDPTKTNFDLGNGYILLATKTDGSKQDECQAQAKNLLISNPTVGCFVGLWEYNPPALLNAIENREKKPIIVGFDENELTLKGIRKGEIIGTVVQNPYEFGYQSIKILASFVQGKNDVLSNWPGIEKDNRIFVPHRVINKENVDAFEAEVNQLLGR